MDLETLRERGTRITHEEAVEAERIIIVLMTLLEVLRKRLREKRIDGPE
jgi:hypothetical protein